MSSGPQRPFKLTIAALGGQGGGVLADWLVEIAEAEGYLAQSTSVPGVAQRTGATIYYLEFFPRQLAERHGREPIMALMPVPGDVDCVLASELAEAGRMIQRRLVTPDRTTVIASSHRTYAIGEKMALGDGATDSQQLAEIVHTQAKRCVMFDMEAIAEKHQSVISSVLLGALCGSGVLPFRDETFRAAIEHGGIAVKTNLAAFEEARARCQTGGSAHQGSEPGTGSAAGRSHMGAAGAVSATIATDPPGAAAAAHPSGAASAGIASTPPGAAGASSPSGALDASSAVTSPTRDVSAETPARARTPELQPLLDRVRRMPPELQPLVLEGARRMVDYQDPAYAALYLDRIERVIAVDTRHKPTPAFSSSAREQLEGSSSVDGSSDRLNSDRLNSDRARNWPLSEATARGLALWMSFEDTIRVADLKTRATRFKRVREEVRAADGQIIGMTEFMKPRVIEIAGTLPAGLGQWVLNSPRVSRWLTGWTGGRHIRTSTVSGFLLLYTLSGLKRWRRGTLRYREEEARIQQWLARIERLAAENYALAVELARAQRLIKGYGETHERGWRNFSTLLEQLDVLLTRPDGAAVLARLQTAALADEEGKALAAELATLQRAPQAA